MRFLVPLHCILTFWRVLPEVWETFQLLFLCQLHFVCLLLYYETEKNSKMFVFVGQIKTAYTVIVFWNLKWRKVDLSSSIQSVFISDEHKAHGGVVIVECPSSVSTASTFSLHLLLSHLPKINSLQFTVMFPCLLFSRFL